VSSGAAEARRAEWVTRRERGSVTLIRLIVWITLHLGRPVARLLLYPACAWYFVFAPKAREASRGWLARVLGRAPTTFDVWRHFWCFSVCVLDRVLLLNGRMEPFDISIHGEAVMDGIRARYGGCFLFGAHLGSFDVARAAARGTEDVRVSVVMYEDNARKSSEVLKAINPAMAAGIIAMGQPGSMIAVKERLDEGYLVGFLADRCLVNERQLKIPFFGEPARFPVGPFRMAAILKQPIVFMTGLYRGGGRYEIHFELIAEPEAGMGRATEQALEETMRRYVGRMEEFCRSAPYNWFNFYDFWG
jgi:predicted LPLAT superfamily acyltransferase